MEGERRSYDLRFPQGSIHLLVGPSASGKTYRVSKILRQKNHLIVDGAKCRNIIFCYSSWQPLYEKLKRDKVVTKWVNKMPTNEEFISLVKPHKNAGGSIVVIDDFQGNINHDLEEIVRVSSRHNNVTTFLLFQSLFPNVKHARQISLQAKFIHLHKNPRENAQINTFARQQSPTNYKWIVDVFHDVTSIPYSCLLIDLTQEREDHLRFRSHYLLEERPMRVYVRKGTLSHI